MTLARPYAKQLLNTLLLPVFFYAWVLGMLALAGSGRSDDALPEDLNPGADVRTQGRRLCSWCAEGHVGDAFGNFILYLFISRLPDPALLRSSLSNTRQNMIVAWQSRWNPPFELSDDSIIYKTLGNRSFQAVRRTVTPHVTINPALIGGCVDSCG